MAERRGSGEEPCGSPGLQPGRPASVGVGPERDLAVGEGPPVPCRVPSVVPAWTRFRARLRRLASSARALWVRARTAWTSRRPPQPPYRHPSN